MWNPWHGCHKFSTGCQHCYVYRTDGKYGKDSSVVAKTEKFNLPVQQKKNKTYKIPSGNLVYTCFTSDFLVEDADEWRPEAWEMMRLRQDLHFLFITKRRSRRHISPDYCLLPDEETVHSTLPDAVAETPDIVTQTLDTVTESPDTATKSTFIKRKEKERKENILPNPPLPKGGDEGEEGGDFSNRKPAKKKHELTQSDIDRMQAPADGHPRNLSGLLDNLRLYHIPPSEQYAIVLKSNYGEIGGKVWKGFGVIRASAGKIKLPGHYLLSVLNN